MNVVKLLTEGLADLLGAAFAVEPDPEKAAVLIRRHIEDRRAKLGLAAIQVYGPRKTYPPPIGGGRQPAEHPMKLASAAFDDREEACILTPRGLIPIATVNRRCSSDWPIDIFDLLDSGALEGLQAWQRGAGQSALAAFPTTEIVPAAALRWRPPYRHPRKIWGIGLNYRAHAAALSESAPRGIPASFMKPDTALIGPGDAIEIPTLSERTTAEAELGVIIGRKCRHVAPGDWLKVVAGFTPVIDITAEDILRQNPRYLTLAKSFDTFFSFGPVVLTPDEIPDVSRLEVATVLNGRMQAANSVANMTFGPDFLVAYHSRVMTLLPGDIISTGTPGAAVIRDGDLVEARITGFPVLANPVRDLKAAPQPNDRCG